MYSLIAWPVLSLGVASVIFAVFEQKSVRFQLPLVVYGLVS